jgi:hypothetical protein
LVRRVACGWIGAVRPAAAVTVNFMDVTPELVLEKVRAAGGSWEVKSADPDMLARWRQAAKVAKLRLLRAGSQRLRSYSEEGKLTLYLVDVDQNGEEIREPPQPYVPAPRPQPRTDEFRGRLVPVPAVPRKPHSIVEELSGAQDYPEQMIYEFRQHLMPRIRRPLKRMRQIWQAIIDEAGFRGYEVLFRHDRRDRFDRGQLVIRIDWDDFPLELVGDHETPLRLTIKERHPARRRGLDTWTDTAERPLHEQLGEIFTFIEEWAELLLGRRERESQQQMEWRRKRERLEAEARRQFAEDFRRKTIAARIADIRFVVDARAYAQVLIVAAENLDADHSASVKAWAAWITEHADRIDPRLTKPGMPKLPEPTHDDLRPYLPARHWY